MAKNFEQPQQPKEERLKEWKEHFGPMAEIREEQDKKRSEFVEKMAKGKEVKKQKEARVQEEADKNIKEELAREQEAVKEAMAQKEGGQKEGVTQEKFLEWLGFSIAEKPGENAGAKQGKVEEKLSAIGKIEKVGKARSEKVANFLAGAIEKGIAHLSALDKWGALAFKGAGKLAVEASGILAGIGLSPFVAAEEVGREVKGRTKMWWEGRKEKSIGKEIGKVEKIKPEGSGEVVAMGLEILRDRARLAREEADKARENLTKKGKLAAFLSKLPFYKRFAE